MSKGLLNRSEFYLCPALRCSFEVWASLAVVKSGFKQGWGSRFGFWAWVLAVVWGLGLSAWVEGLGFGIQVGFWV